MKGPRSAPGATDSTRPSPGLRFRRISDWSSYKLLFLVILLALPLRVYWMTTQTPVMSCEGSEYVRMAESLANGSGLVGNFPGPATMYSPLFSVLTAGVYLLVRNVELAAHLVSLTLGVALVVPVYLTGQMMYGKRVALIAALITAIHPVLVKLSASIYNENVYLFWLMLGIYLGLRCLESRKIQDCVLLGACLGLAYLSRPEALAYSFFFALAFWLVASLTRKANWGSAAHAMAIVGTSLLVALPYAWFLYTQTGHVRLEGKWDINYTMANRMRSGMDDFEAAYGLDRNDEIAGPLLDPFHFAAYTPYPNSMPAKVKTLLAMAERHRSELYRFFDDPETGAPLLSFLIAIGLFRMPWKPRRLLHETVLLLISASILFLLVTSSMPSFRYLLALIPITTLWMSKGLVELNRWSKTMRSSLSAAWLPAPKVIGLAIPSAALLLILSISWYGTEKDWLFVDDETQFSDLKEAGRWIRAHSKAGRRVVCYDTVLTFYSKATIIGLPYAPPVQVLGYVRSHDPDFIVLDSRDASLFPAVKDWIAHGIPDYRAQLVFDAASTDGSRIEIFRWRHSGKRIQLDPTRRTFARNRHGNA